MECPKGDGKEEKKDGKRRGERGEGRGSMHRHLYSLAKIILISGLEIDADDICIKFAQK